MEQVIVPRMLPKSMSDRFEYSIWREREDLPEGGFWVKLTYGEIMEIYNIAIRKHGKEIESIIL